MRDFPPDCEALALSLALASVSGAVRRVATAPRTTAPVNATAAATGPPTREAEAMRAAVVFAPLTASGTTGQPPSVCSTCVSSGDTGVAGADTGVFSSVAVAGSATGSVLISVMLDVTPSRELKGLAAISGR
ncbi:hypothetical protein DXZ75_13390 [Streptomyces sp. AcE210]|nr:hypothetical protein DXZ75_13390 [Streptomyces sp. AcE210]